MRSLVVLLMTMCAIAPLAAQDKPESRAAYRYRVAIAEMLQLKPGQAFAELGPGAGFLSAVVAPKVEPGGRAVVIQSTSGLQSATLDGIALVDSFTSTVRTADVLREVAAALKPGGALLVVDVSREGVGAVQQGIDAEELVAAATAAGLKREAESGIVPGHFSIRFRKQS